MHKDYITFGGKRVRVEANWNAIVNYCRAQGKTSLECITGLSDLQMEDIAPLMAACINEGERLDGRESNLDALTIGSTSGWFQAISEFVQVYTGQLAPALAPDKKKE